MVKITLNLMMFFVVSSLMAADISGDQKELAMRYEKYLKAFSGNEDIVVMNKQNLSTDKARVITFRKNKTLINESLINRVEPSVSPDDMNAFDKVIVERLPFAAHFSKFLKPNLRQAYLLLKSGGKLIMNSPASILNGGILCNYREDKDMAHTGAKIIAEGLYYFPEDFPLAIYVDPKGLYASFETDVEVSQRAQRSAFEKLLIPLLQDAGFTHFELVRAEKDNPDWIAVDSIPMEMLMYATK